MKCVIFYLLGSPKIDAAFGMRDITVMAGEEFTIRVPFSAFPVPTATWTIVRTI